MPRAAGGDAREICETAIFNEKGWERASRFARNSDLLKTPKRLAQTACPRPRRLLAVFGGVYHARQF